VICTLLLSCNSSVRIESVGSEVARRAWWVDALHATSMLAVAGVAPSQRRLAATDATVAVVFAVAGDRGRV